MVLGANFGGLPQQLLAFTVNLEHVGDIIDRSLRALAAKKIKYQLTFSPEGQAEIVDMHRHVLAQLRLAASVLMTSDPRMARSLVVEKLAIETWKTPLPAIISSGCGMARR